MNKFYWRVNYKNIGIYDAFKKELWKKSENLKRGWNNIKMSDAFCWLKNPDVCYENCSSYFTESGYELFKNNTYPIFAKYLDEESIFINKYNFNESELDILYEDEHQIVVRN